VKEGIRLTLIHVTVNIMKTLDGLQFLKCRFFLILKLYLTQKNLYMVLLDSNYNQSYWKWETTVPYSVFQIPFQGLHLHICLDWCHSHNVVLHERWYSFKDSLV